MRSWSAIKKRIRSKTYHVASVMLSIGVTVETYSPEIKQVVAEKIGVSWGIAYAVMFALAMQFMREITKEPISAKGERDVKEPNKRDDQVMDDSDFDDSNSDDESMDSVSGTIDYPAAEIRPIDDGSKETTLRRSAQGAKRVHRGKRRR